MSYSLKIKCDNLQELMDIAARISSPIVAANSRASNVEPGKVITTQATILKPEVPAPTVTPPETQETDGLTLEHLYARTQESIIAGKSAPIKAFFAKYGVKNVKQLPETHWAEYLKMLDA